LNFLLKFKSFPISNIDVGGGPPAGTRRPRVFWLGLMDFLALQVVRISRWRTTACLQGGHLRLVGTRQWRGITGPLTTGLTNWASIVLITNYGLYANPCKNKPLLWFYAKKTPTNGVICYFVSCRPPIRALPIGSSKGTANQDMEIQDGRVAANGGSPDPIVRDDGCSGSTAGGRTEEWRIEKWLQRPTTPTASGGRPFLPCKRGAVQYSKSRRPNVRVCDRGTATYWKSHVSFSAFSPWRGKLGCLGHSRPHSSRSHRLEMKVKLFPCI
jgi:hypothetical protein